MSEKGLTNISLKKINKSKVYQYIYRKKTTSKLQIVQELQMGLSTVSQNLNLSLIHIFCCSPFHCTRYSAFFQVL